MAKWSSSELAALHSTHDYHEWAAITNYSKSYDAWETKRRRVEQVDPREDEDNAALIASLTMDANREKVFKKLAERELTVPHLGVDNPTPAFVGFNMAFFDLETTNLKANFARLLCGSVADNFGNVTTFRCDDPLLSGEKRRDDSKLAVALRDFLETFDIIVGWNSKMFDVPWLNTRLLIYNERPLSTDLMHIDPMYKAGRGSLALHSKRLDAVAKTFRLDSQKTALDPDKWLDAADGDTDALDYIVEHCEADCLTLRAAFHVLKPLMHLIHR